ncbi:MAG: Ketose-bisphosphate aldolase, class-II [Candidatus Taylorbacteria bacterium]|nr:Ketose-bisphosphate aldolase, class-II [Candidatus Taylorbacteria bacterium]
MNTQIKSLREYVKDALARKVGVGHFNIASLDAFWAVVNAQDEMTKAARNLPDGAPGKIGADEQIPVIIGASEGERDFIGVDQVVALVRSVREPSAANTKLGYPNGRAVFLNADHTYSFERVAEAADAGFDAVIIDQTELPFDQNVAITKKCVEYVHEVTKKTGRDIMIEAEIGFIGKSSKVLDAVPEGVKISEEFLTKPEEAKAFVDATGVDMLAPAVGNIHGMLKGGVDPALNTKRIAEISAAAGVPLVLHGGSGGSIADFLGAIDGGCGIVHISTELRVALRAGLVKALQDNPDEVAPYKYLKPARAAMQKAVEDKLKLFNKI